MLKLILILTVYCCSVSSDKNESIKPGKYKGSFTADGKHALITDLQLKKNGTFKKKSTITSLGSTLSKGKWEINGDTLILHYDQIKDLRRDTVYHCSSESVDGMCEVDYFFINNEKLYYFKNHGGNYREELK